MKSKRLARESRSFDSAQSHVYVIGQEVRMRSSFRRLPTTFKIIATMPPNGGDLQYRIRSDEENHERVTTQDNLEPVTELRPAGKELDALATADLVFGRAKMNQAI